METKSNTMSEELTAPLPQSRAEDMEKEPIHDQQPGDSMAASAATHNNEGAKEEEEGMMSTEDGTMGGGSPAIRPIFFGNLSHGCVASDVEGIFERPVVDAPGGEGEFWGVVVVVVVAAVAVMVYDYLIDNNFWLCRSLLTALHMNYSSTHYNNKYYSTRRWRPPPSLLPRPSRHETRLLLRVSQGCFLHGREGEG